MSCSFFERNPAYFYNIKQCFGNLLIKIFIFKKIGTHIFQDRSGRKNFNQRILFSLNAPFQKISIKECAFLSSLSKAEIYRSWRNVRRAKTTIVMSIFKNPHRIWCRVENMIDFIRWKQPSRGVIKSRIDFKKHSSWRTFLRMFSRELPKFLWTGIK